MLFLLCKLVAGLPAILSIWYQYGRLNGHKVGQEIWYKSCAGPAPEIELRILNVDVRHLTRCPLSAR